MKFFYLFAFILLTTLTLKAQAQNVSFPGGLDSLYRSLKQIRYNTPAYENKISGCTTFIFKIDSPTYKLSYCSVSNDLPAGITGEVLYQVAKFPSWNPKAGSNQIVPTIVVLPLSYKLDTIKGATRYSIKRTPKISSRDTLFLDTIEISHIDAEWEEEAEIQRGENEFDNHWKKFPELTIHYFKDGKEKKLKNNFQFYFLEKGKKIYPKDSAGKFYSPYIDSGAVVYFIFKKDTFGLNVKSRDIIKGADLKFMKFNDISKFKVEKRDTFGDKTKPVYETDYDINDRTVALFTTNSEEVLNHVLKLALIMRHTYGDGMYTESASLAKRRRH